MPEPRFRVLVVDDSVFMRTILKDALARSPELEVIGSAQNGNDGLQAILTLRPDVVTLDVEMPGLNGIQVLERVMRERPTPIVVVSTKTQLGASLTVEALEKGAIECVAKPLARDATLERFREAVVRAVLAAAQSSRRNLVGAGKRAVIASPTADVPLDGIVAIGISAGGPQTLHQLLPAFPARFPPILVTQHMPAGFTKPFAERLNAACKGTVVEAAGGETLTPGHIYIAPGDKHLLVSIRGSKPVTHLSAGPKVSGFRPSVDALFDSLKESASRTVAVVMTGMGCDGSAGVRTLKRLGAYTIAQDRETSIVYGMPKAAAETGAIDQIAPLCEIPGAIAGGLKRLLVPT
ncbi:MAG: chemotaxis response regulator protein-glutamate methylesterase [Planctomycetes bacterium]|nr:chemotaxis response regulator protein-glutamate methylesterase [Planctomycetota bacterium]